MVFSSFAFFAFSLLLGDVRLSYNFRLDVTFVLNAKMKMKKKNWGMKFSNWCSHLAALVITSRLTTRCLITFSVEVKST